MHLKGGTKNCGIYSTKPEECTSFKCLWLMGVGASKDRPDRSGIFLYGSTSVFGEAIIASEVWLDSSKHPKAEAVMLKSKDLANRIGAKLMVRRHAPIIEQHTSCGDGRDNE